MPNGNDYTYKLYEWIASTDGNFAQSVSPEAFEMKMKDDDYALRMYDWISSVDDTFRQKKSVDDFLFSIKKKPQEDLPSRQSTEDILSDLRRKDQAGLSDSTQESVDFVTEVPSFSEAVPSAQMPIQPSQPREDDRAIVSSFIEETKRNPEALELERTDTEKRLPSSISSGPVENMFPEKVTESTFVFDDDNLNILQKISNNSVAMGMLANRIDTESADNIDFEEIAYYNRVLEKNQVGSEERSFLGFLKDIATTLPTSLVSKIIAAPSAGAETAAGAAGGSVLPGVGSALGATAAFSGATSMNIEYAMSLMQSLKEAGVDVTNGEELKKAFKDEKILSKAREYAERRSAPIAVLDGLSAGFAGSFVSSLGKSGVKRVAAESAEQAVQASLGAGGEFLAQKFAGDETDWYSIALEAVSDPAAQIAGRTVKAISNKATSKEEKDYLFRVENEPGVSVRTDVAYLNNKDIVQLNNDIQTLRETKRKAKSVGVRKAISDELKSKRKEKYARINEELEKTLNLSEDKIEQIEALTKDISDLKNAYNESENKEEKRIIKEAIQKKKGEINNAIQEQSTDEVLVQPDATVSEEVEERVPETEPEVVTEQIEEKEVTPEVEQEVTDLEAALNKSEVKANQFQLAQEVNDEELSKASGTTQVANTRGSYIKAIKKISDIEGDVLDYGAGLGIGTDAMSETIGRDVESLEINPERWKGKKPVNYTNSNQIDKKFDGIVSLNVVNVVPKDVRDFIVKDIFSKLNVGGKSVISSRGFKDDIQRSKNFEVGPEEKSYIVKRKKDGETIDVYQKGFDGDELVDYVKDLLGDNVEVKKDNTFGKSGVIITKTKDDASIQPSLSVKSERVISEETQQRIADEMSEYKKARKIYDIRDTKGEKAKRYKINVVQNKDLVDKVPRVSLDMLKGKKVNFVVLDKAMYNKNKGMTSGVFGALSDEYFGKIAHSVGLKAQAEAIADASAKSDYTVGIIMGNAGIDSNIYMYRDLVRQLKATGKESEYFKMFKDRVKGLNIPKASKKIVMESTSFDNLDTKYKQLGSETARKIIQGVMPSKSTKNPRTPIYNALAKEKIFLEDTRFSNEEKATMNIPSGSPFIVMELQDYSGKKITEKTKDQAIIDEEIRQEEGIQEDDNYSYMLRGTVTGVFDETTPAYNIAPELAEEYVEGPRTGEKKITRRKKLETPDKLTKSQYIYRPFEASVGEGQRLAIRKLDKGQSRIYDLETDIVDPYTSFMTNLSTAFPSINVVTDKNLFEERKSSLKEFSLMSKDQKIYGFVDGETGSIYLNPSLENYNTPLHEFGHVWLNVARHARPDLYKRGLELIEDSEYYNNIKNSKQYQKLSENMTESQKEEYIKNEALATAIGDRGEAFVKQGKKKFAEFKSWMTQLFKYIKSLVGLSKYTAEQVQNITMDEFLDAVAVDLMSGEKVFAEEQSKNLISDLQLMTEKSVDENSLYEIIEKSRGLGFSDQAIKIVLQKKGFKVSEINKAMLIPFDVFSDIPLAFGNVPGGMLEGSKIYKDITNELLKKKNTEGKSTSEIRLLAQDLLKKNESFKNLNDTLQKELLISLDKSLMTTENKDVARDIRDMKRTLKDRRFAAREAQKLKTDLRNFIRANMPKASWSTSEVNTILREITDARINKEYYKLVEKPENDIRTVMYKVIDMINKKNSKMYMSQIEKLMNVKEEKKVAGRIQGRYTVEGVDRIKAFKEYMRLNDKSPIDEVEENIKELKKIEETLSNKQNLNDSDFKKMEMVNVAILYNEALLMDNKEEAKAQSLYEVSNKIKAILSGERSEFRETQEQKHEYYKSLQKDAIEAISGQKVDLDSDESIKNLKENLSKKTNIKDNRPKIKKALINIGNSVDFILKRIESLEGLLDRITTESTDIFGGKLSDIIENRINESSRNYKQGKNELFEYIRQNAKRIYGKDYKKVIQKNNKKRYEIYTNKEEVDALKSKLGKTKERKEKRKIADEIKSKTLRLTQNEMYYHYNQYKDLANHPGYEEKKNWGDNTPNIMNQINETLDPRVIEWADWQVNEFFPNVYDRYNAVYREIYKTNMPWNAQYAGRLLRETKAEDVEDSDLFNQMSTAYQNNIGSQSTKARVKNKRAILDANGDAVLMDYISDMEYFRAYAETMRDISKIYRNNLVKDAIVATTSEDTYNVIFNQSIKNPGMIAKILNRDLSKSGSEGKLFNTMTRNFVVSRLGLNPTIFLKQMTSALAFADYIGYANWTGYAAKNLFTGAKDVITFKNFNKTWKEMYNNSPELQDRYDQGDFSRVLETYTREASEELSGGVKMGKVMDAMMYLVKQGDKGGVMGSIPNYLYYKDLYKKKNPKNTEQDAIEFAIRRVEKQIKSTQQDQDIQNKDFYQTGNWYQRWLSMFQSSGRALLRKEISSIRNLYRKLKAWDKSAGKGTLGQNIRTFITYHVGVPMFFQYVALGLPGLFKEWDEEDEDDLGYAAVLGNLNAIFALGDIFSSIRDFIKGNPWAGDARALPLYDMFANIADSVSRYKSAKKEETKNKYAMKALTSVVDLSGLPASQVNKMVKNYRKILDKEYKTDADYREAVARFFGYGDYQLKSSKKKKDKKPTIIYSNEKTPLFK